MFGDQIHAQHMFKQFRGFVGIRREFHAAALAPAACMDLCLHDTLAAVGFGDLPGVLGIGRDPTVRRGHFVLPKQFFGLKLMDVHAYSEWCP